MLRAYSVERWSVGFVARTLASETDLTYPVQVTVDAACAVRGWSAAAASLVRDPASLSTAPAP